VDSDAGPALQVDGAAGQALDGSAENPPDGGWAAQNGVDGLAGLEVAQHGLIPVLPLDQHGWYLVWLREKELRGVYQFPLCSREP